MKLHQHLWTRESIGFAGENAPRDFQPGLVLVFGSTDLLREENTHAAVRSLYPEADIVGCSTAGEIVQTSVRDDTVAVTAIQFDTTLCRIEQVEVDHYGSSFELGRDLVSRLETERLAHVFLLSDGLHVNGSRLVSGAVAGLPDHVSLTGGLSGDGGRFKDTVVMCNGPGRPRVVACAGLYGNDLRIGYGSVGGWDAFGMERQVTKSIENVLYEIDGQPALEIYKKYLGAQAASLPASGLMYPLSIRTCQQANAIVRTILAVDEASRSITFAGDVPEGSFVRLMKANIDRLIDGAVQAASISKSGLGGRDCEFAILISCIGRKLVMTQRTEEEVEAVQDILGPNTMMTGFYSYGEISAFSTGAACELHNQTMTITTLSELSR